MIIDNKRWDVPTTKKAQEYLAKQNVRGQLRTPDEGLKPFFVKPCKRKHRMNAGGSVSVCAGISGGRIVLWEYVKGRWNGQEAARMYSGPILTTLRRHRRHRRVFKVLEDNDPTGYKSSKGLKAKKESGIKTIDLPRYSPDLNPLDYSIWSLIEERVTKRAPAGSETKASYLKRLRLTALRLPSRLVTKAVMGMKSRIKAVHQAGGKDIKKD